MTQAHVTDLPVDVVLRDGSTIQLRPVEPTDRDLLILLFAGLSEESRHFRFFAGRRVDASLVEPLLTVAGEDGLTLVAEREGRLLATVSWFRSAKPPTRAEVAFVVADELQGCGIGTRMLERLAELARDHGITEFEAFVLPYNTTMRRVFFDSGFEVSATLEEGVNRFVLNLRETPALCARMASRAERAASASMRAFFRPSSIAVIGASRDPRKVGGAIVRNIRAAGFPGLLYAVNPHAEDVEDIPTVARIGQIPTLIDLAVVAVPGNQVEQVVDECIRSKVKALVLISAGFSETGPLGRELEARLVMKIRGAGIRLIGPNCMGIINTAPDVSLNASFAPGLPPCGGVAFLSQSGALGLAMLEQARELGIGLSSFVSVGNKADVSGNDLVQYWAADPATDVILLYLESFGNPRNFSRIARRVSRSKPIVAVKAGRSGAGARAAASHTGAMASDDAVVDALFEQSGVIRTRTLEELFDVAKVLEQRKLPRGSGVAILTNAGGPGILAADACEAEGLEVPVLPMSAQTAIRRLVPRAASVGNPVDLLASATAEDYRQAFEALAAEPTIDSILVLFVPVLSSAAAVGRALDDAAARTDKLVISTFLDQQVRPASLPCFQFPENAVRALARVTSYAAWRRRPMAEPPLFTDIELTKIDEIVNLALERGGGWLDPAECERLVSAIGLPMVASRFATTVSGAVAAASSMGFPVAVKALGPTIVHKSDVRGVHLHLLDEESVGRVCQKMRDRLGDALQGFVVQRMAPEGPEMLIGGLHHPTFGPLMACGTGGVLTEIVGDAVFRLVPLSEPDASEMVADTRGARLLSGYRGFPAADAAAFSTALLRVSALLENCPAVQELDLNPVRVLTSGIIVLDARVRIGTPEQAPTTRRVWY